MTLPVYQRVLENSVSEILAIFEEFEDRNSFFNVSFFQQKSSQLLCPLSLVLPLLSPQHVGTAEPFLSGADASGPSKVCASL